MPRALHACIPNPEYKNLSPLPPMKFSRLHCIVDKPPPPCMLQPLQAEDPSKSYRLLEQIGKGAYGRVYRTQDLSSGTVVAAKVVELPTHEGDGEEDQTALLLQEIATLTACSTCSHVLRYHASFLHGNRLYLMTELCHAGSMADVMQSMGRPLEEAEIAAALAGALCALCHLHERNILHRDLKAANLLLTERGDIKLGDFGVSVALTRTLERRSTVIGTPHWSERRIRARNRACQVVISPSLLRSIRRALLGCPYPMAATTTCASSHD